MGKTTVREYLERARKAGLGWPLPEGMDEVALETKLFRRSVDEYRPGRPEPDWREVHRELKRGRHVTQQLLWLEYKERHPDGWGYTQFCVHFRRWLERQDVVMRLEHRAGERMFIDFAGDTFPVVRPETGEIWAAEIFVAVLGASGYLYVEALRGQDLESWLAAHVHALDFVQGVPEILVPDYVERHIIVVLCPPSLCGRHGPGPLAEAEGAGAASSPVT